MRSRGLRARADRQLRVSNMLLSRSYAALARQAERRSVPILHIASDDRDVAPPADEDGVEAPLTVEGEP